MNTFILFGLKGVDYSFLILYWMNVVAHEEITCSREPNVAHTIDLHPVALTKEETA